MVVQTYCVRAYKLFTIQIIKATTTKVPINPYPNIFYLLILAALVSLREEHGRHVLGPGLTFCAVRLDL